jgi:NAD-dependent SIR2 family protein deacetylase
MQASELKNEIKNKQKTIKDIARYIKNQTDHVPNFCLLLGAGCSVSSGIRSGETLVTEWRKEVYEQLSSRPSNEAYTDEDAKNYLKENEQSWYSPSKEYSSLFERKFDLPRQRRMFVEKEVTGKSPSIGYAYFINIINKRFFNTIFTTNFDDLVNEAFYLFSNERPIICAHDSAISSVTVTSSRPKIIKLHGDYLFDDIKTTLRETETLEQNMQAKFIEFAKDYGLIVIGYSGGDRSIMDTLNQLQKNDDYYKNGIYWCLRHNTEVNEDLRKLLRHERVFYVLIDGFDEFMAEVHEELFDEELPISTSTFTRKPVEIISGFMQNSQTTNTSSKKIKCDLEKLKRVSGKNSLFELIKEIELKDDAKVSREIDDQELISLLEISQCFDNEKFVDYSLYDCSITFNDTFNMDKMINLYHQVNNQYPNETNINRAILHNKINQIELDNAHACSIAAMILETESVMNLKEGNRTWSIPILYNTIPIEDLYTTVKSMIVSNNYQTPLKID